MKNLIAQIESGSNSNLSNQIKVINNGRNDDTYFYLANNQVSVSNPYRQLSETEQLNALTWLLGSKVRLI